MGVGDGRHWRSRRRRCGLSAALLLLFFATALGGTVARRREQEEGQWARRRLVGPGSSPPTCRGRCGGCYPCRPVHVAIQPGRSFPLEYYPEAWRCKCGNKLFMP